MAIKVAADTAAATEKQYQNSGSEIERCLYACNPDVSARLSNKQRRNASAFEINR
jgi:hypothetical protein